MRTCRRRARRGRVRLLRASHAGPQQPPARLGAGARGAGPARPGHSHGVRRTRPRRRRRRVPGRRRSTPRSARSLRRPRRAEPSGRRRAAAPGAVRGRPGRPARAARRPRRAGPRTGRDTGRDRARRFSPHHAWEPGPNRARRCESRGASTLRRRRPAALWLPCPAPGPGRDPGRRGSGRRRARHPAHGRGQVADLPAHRLSGYGRRRHVRWRVPPAPHAGHLAADRAHEGSGRRAAGRAPAARHRA